MHSSDGTNRPQAGPGPFAESGPSSGGTADVSTMLHDLTQPLSSISNYALGCRQRLQSGNFDAKELLSVIERISAEAKRAGDLVKLLRQACADAPKGPQ